MKEIKQYKINTKETRKYIFGSIFFGFLVSTPIWILILFFKKTEIALNALFEFHKNNPALIIVDLLPVLFGLTAYFITNSLKTEFRQIHEELNQKNELIQKNTEFAKSIGKGDFSSLPEKIDADDTIGNSLLLMRDNLVANYQKENEQNWIARGKEIIRDVLSHHTNIEVLAYETLVSLINYTNTVQGAFYIYDDVVKKMVNIASYAYNRKKYINQSFKIGQGLVGQAAFEKDFIYRREIPDEYTTISSGILGTKKPKTILVVPLISDEKLQGVIEFASLDEHLQQPVISLVRELGEIIAQTLYNLKVNTRTENLLRDSQELTKRLQKNEEDLRKNAQQMQHTQIELENSNRELASQIAEVERGQKRLSALLQNASEVITIYDSDGIVKYVSPSVKNILGFDTEEMIGKNRFERGESILQEAFNQLLREPHIPRTFEYRYQNKNKEQLWLETTGRNLLNNSAINGIIFNTRDITVRKVAERAQRMSGEMQALSENSPDLIIRIAPDGKFYYANPMITEYMGVTPIQVIKRSIDEANINNQIKDIFRNVLTTVLESGKKFDAETIFKTDEHERIIQLNAIPEYNKQREMETVLFVAHDITERKRIELEIEEKNKSITESINYAQRIQTAIIPDTDLIMRFLPKSFVLYKPRDVVSGDFPWFFENGENVYIAAVDCTGHGVPGALLSFIGYFILNNIVDHDNGLSAGQILDRLHAQVRKTLKQDTPEANARDGMDIALCKINSRAKELQYAGAHRPMYFCREKEVSQYKGDPKAVGGIPIKRQKKEDDFVNYSIKVETGDKIFIFSDGLPDQIGGEDGRKYQAKRIRDLIVENSELTMSEYYDFFERDLNLWKGKFKQIDDILLIGIEF
jgi:PAS domain S-box-containing protein